ncbi:hypothetical protein CEXT_126681 [Caerostris extrusa]|uniref:Uncharacterized protein n=1 Tax=Caerostris extrusa TaxID=172846 RepID=A0AAV4NZU1_CAEEX|nr:hypothetical protein CEXT_126681 [Caerostris extrusa]
MLPGSSPSKRRTWRHLISSPGNSSQPPKWDINTFLSTNNFSPPSTSLSNSSVTNGNNAPSRPLQSSLNQSKFQVMMNCATTALLNREIILEAPSSRGESTKRPPSSLCLGPTAKKRHSNPNSSIPMTRSHCRKSKETCCCELLWKKSIS